MFNFKELAKQLPKISSGYKLAGIYLLINEGSDNVYVGSSLDIYRRTNRHKVELNKNVHVNPHLQNAWNKYGESQFSFHVLEVIEKKDSCPTYHLERENFYLLKNPKNTYYNSQIPAVSCKGKPKGIRATDAQKYKTSKTCAGVRKKKLSETHRRIMGQKKSEVMGFKAMTYEWATFLKKESEILKTELAMFQKHSVEYLAKKHGFTRTMVLNILQGRHWTNPNYLGYKKPHSTHIPKYKILESQGFKPS